MVTEVENALLLDLHVALTFDSVLDPCNEKSYAESCNFICEIYVIKTERERKKGKAVPITCRGGL
jgi:hypothetical protein